MKTAPRSRDSGLFQKEPEPIKRHWLKGFLFKMFFLQNYFTVITYLKYQMLETFSILHILITLAYYDTKKIIKKILFTQEQIFSRKIINF